MAKDPRLSVRGTVLIVDDESSIRDSLRMVLEYEDYRVQEAANGEEAITQVRRSPPDAILLDIKMPDMDGLEVLQALRDRGYSMPVIVITGHGDVSTAIDATRKGAYDFFEKPLERDRVLLSLRNALESYRLQQDSVNVRSEPDELIGTSSAMQRLRETIDKAAPSNAAVLIIGESGTGKEMVARTIHYLSSRRAGLFQPVNCGSIPEALLDSELFGHEKGALSGSEDQARGKLELADCGTLLLAEIDAMSSSLQVKMLRFLKEKVMQRAGGQYDIPVDVRILAATNIDVDKAVTAGRIRDDLFYRLGVISISLPPLRERGDDVTLLAHFFLRKYAAEYNKRVRSFSTAAIHILLDYAWPGNVSELENRVRRAVVMADGPIVEPSLLGFDIDTDAEVISQSAVQEDLVCALSGKTLQEARADVERKLILSTFEREQNIARTARSLGVSRPTLYDLMKKHDILMTTTPAQPPL